MWLKFVVGFLILVLVCLTFDYCLFDFAALFGVYFEAPRPLSVKTNGEMRSLQTAIDDFLIAKEPANRGNPYLLDQFEYGMVHWVWRRLTTPTQYITSFPRDDYNPAPSSYMIASVSNQFLLQSRGPDGILDMTPEDIREILERPDAEEFRLHSWSPTNGIKSSGDIVRYWEYERAKKETP
jgi:hypothetical protein